MPKLKISQLLQGRVHIVGVSGSEGAAVALWLIKLGQKQLVGHDFKTNKEFEQSFCSYHTSLSKAEQNKLLKRLKGGLTKLHLRDTYLSGISEADYVIVPSSWFRYAPNNPKLTKLVKQKPKIVFNIYTLLLSLYQGSIVGVTGTAGKGTTVQFIKLMLPKALTMGGPWQHNDFGRLLNHGQNKGILIVEVNNRQLTMAPAVRLSPPVGVITNITVNHLDDHQGSFAKYRQSKWQLIAYQKKADAAVLNADDPNCRLLARRARGRVRLFGLTSRADLDATVKDGWIMLRRGRQWQKIVSLKSLPPSLIADHFKYDALAAVLAADIMGASINNLARALWHFKPQEGRLSLVKKSGFITVINDTAATRPEATSSAVKAFANYDIHLILGGMRRFPQTTQYNQLFKVIKNSTVVSVAMIGGLAPWLFKLAQCNKLPQKINKFKDLSAAVKWSIDDAKQKKLKRLQLILLSPACESFGEFVDYRQRGEVFKKSIEKYL